MVMTHRPDFICALKRRALSTGLLTAAIWIVASPTLAASATSQPTSAAAIALPPRAILHLENPVQDKNFYFLSTLLDDAAARRAISADAELGKLAVAKRQALVGLNGAAATPAAAFVSPMLWTDAEIAAVTTRLRQLCEDDPAASQRVCAQLRSSGLFIRYAALPDSDLLAKAWSDAAAGMNHIVQAYGLGQMPRTGKIDAVPYDVKSEAFRHVVQDVSDAVEDATRDDSPFFAAPLQFDLDLMYISRRDEAGREEPLEAGVNRLPLEQIGATDWGRFRYSVILVPGAAPGGVNESISAAGTVRVELAARRFHDGLAPFILVSGGYVSPPQTRFCEALEMRRVLMERFGVPAAAILVDPHARHTTTNLRNGVRLMYRYGVPLDKPGLITTDRYQSEQISDPRFMARCERELGYDPVTLGKRTSREDVEFLPRVESLQADALDPLDP